MSLGIYDRLWELLEGACTGLDLLLAKHVSVGGLGSSYDEYVAALKKREELSVSLTAAEQRVTMLDQLVTYFSLHLPNPSQNQQLKIIREAASKALLGVAAVVNNSAMFNQELAITLCHIHRSKRYKVRRLSSRKSSSPEMVLTFSLYQRV